MKTKIKLVDRSSGMYAGDLKYGRCNGNIPVNGRDFSSQNGSNEPVMKLQLVRKRDPKLWRKDGRVSSAKKLVQNSQQGINYLLNVFLENQKRNSFNLKLRIGKQLF